MKPITTSMRDVLIEHLDGQAVPIVRVATLSGLDASRASDRAQTVKSLLIRGLLRTRGRKKPSHTVITDTGRAELAKLLAEYAEVLVRSGILLEDMKAAVDAELLRRALVDEPRKVSEPKDLKEAV